MKYQQVQFQLPSSLLPRMMEDSGTQNGLPQNSLFDTNVKIPFDIEATASDITLKEDESKSINISLSASSGNNRNSSIPLLEVEIAVIGMTESGLHGDTYTSQLQRVNLSQNLSSRCQDRLDSKRRSYIVFHLLPCIAGLLLEWLQARLQSEQIERDFFKKY